MSTPAEKNAKVFAVLQAEQKPIGPTEIARRINEPWCVGDSVNLGQGHDFAVRIESACNRMAEAMKAFDDARKAMTSYAVAVASSKTEGGAA